MSTNKQPYRADGGDLSTGRLKEIADNPYGDEEKCWLAKRVLALLDELEVATDACNGWQRKFAELEASHGNLREAVAGIHNTITGEGAYTPLAAILNVSKRAYEESAAAAGKGE